MRAQRKRTTDGTLTVTLTIQTYINPLFKGDKKKLKEALESKLPKSSKQEKPSSATKVPSKVQVGRYSLILFNHQVVQRDIEDKNSNAETENDAGSTETDDFNLTDEVHKVYYKFD